MKNFYLRWKNTIDLVLRPLIGILGLIVAVVAAHFILNYFNVWQVEPLTTLRGVKIIIRDIVVAGVGLVALLGISALGYICLVESFYPNVVVPVQAAIRQDLYRQTWLKRLQKEKEQVSGSLSTTTEISGGELSAPVSDLGSLSEVKDE